MIHNHLNATPVALAVGDTVRVGSIIYRFNGENYQYTTETTNVHLEPNQIVLIRDTHTAGGVAGTAYKYIGTSTLENQNLSAEDFTADPNKWQPVTRDLTTEDYSSADWSENVINLSEQNYRNLGVDEGSELWSPVTEPLSQNILVDAESTSSIESLVGAISGALGGGTVGVAGSVGASFGRNLIGQLDYDFQQTEAAGHFAWVKQGDRVRLVSGEIFEFVGAKSSDEDPDDPKDGIWGEDLDHNEVIWLDLASAAQNYAHNKLWRALGSSAGNEVSAYVNNSTLISAGDLDIHADADETVSATVFAGSVAISIGAVAISVAGAGVSAVNELGSTVHGFIDNSSVMAMGDLDISALSASQITDSTAVAGAVSIAAGIGGAVAVAVTLVDNVIANDVQAYIGGEVGDGVLVGGGVSILANVEHARVNKVEARYCGVRRAGCRQRCRRRKGLAFTSSLTRS